MEPNHGARIPSLSNQLVLSLDNDLQCVAEVVHQLQSRAQYYLSTLNSRWLLHFGTAIDEALTNAILHGNLEISSQQRFAPGYDTLLQERRNSFPYRRRKVQLEATFDNNAACVTVADEGPGFDHTKVPDPTAIENLERPHGRGVMMIRSYMDVAEYNEAGNVLLMVKRTE